MASFTIFFNVQSAQSVIKLFEITEKTINAVKNVLDERWEDIIAIPETQKMHSVIVTSVNVVRYARYVKSEQWKVHVFKELNHNYQSLSGNDVTLRVEDFVEVEYNGKRYAREVKLIEEDVQVSVLHRHFSQNWKWPAPQLF